MPTKPQIDAMNLYAGLMTEIKIRIAAINTGTTNQIHVPPPIVKEFCFLQLRMICELVALGCLVAHGDISAIKKPTIQKAWNAEEIMEALERLHPDFFPKPVIQHLESSGHFRLDPRIPNPLTKNELLHIYNRKCGETLHRGSIKKLLSQKTPIQVHYPEITAIAQKIQDLLSFHTVTTLDGQLHFICTLFNANDNMNVQVAIAEASDSPPGFQ